MGKNESRSERKQAQKNVQTESKSGLSKVYYWIIGGLFLILILLVVYIFAKSGDQVNLEGEEETSSIVQKKETEETESAGADEKEEKSEEISEADESDENQEKQKTEDEEEIKDETTEDETVVDDDAPLDTDYAVDYTSGSADRVAIKNKVMQATGLGNDLIESWVGNNGPGRVTADVHSPDQSEVYRVYLQYGDGEWHVTNYESLSSVPNN